MSDSTAALETSGTSSNDVDVNPRGIPKAAFIVLAEAEMARIQESVEEFLGGPDLEAEPELAKLNEMLAKYRFMEKSFTQKKVGLEDKIPEFQNTIDVLLLLEQKRDDEETLETHFELTDTLFAKAAIEPVQEVYLWLGANTMLSYPPSEARQLLEDKLRTARTNLDNTKQDLLFLREQITTTEVNVARLYNHDVKLRRDRRIRAEAEEKEK